MRNYISDYAKRASRGLLSLFYIREGEKAIAEEEAIMKMRKKAKMALDNLDQHYPQEPCPYITDCRTYNKESHVCKIFYTACALYIDRLKQEKTEERR